MREERFIRNLCIRQVQRDNKGFSDVCCRGCIKFRVVAMKICWMYLYSRLGREWSRVGSTRPPGSGSLLLFLFAPAPAHRYSRFVRPRDLHLWGAIRGNWFIQQWIWKFYRKFTSRYRKFTFLLEFLEILAWEMKIW